MSKPKTRVVAGIALAAVLLLGGCVVLGLTAAPTGPSAGPSRLPEGTPGEVPAEVQPVTVRRVVDGDTVEVAAVTTGAVLDSTAQLDVRLLEIDTPETVHSSEPVQCYGEEASDTLRRLLPPGSRAWVQRDEDLRDRYGRYLLYLWNADGVFVNLRMVRDGYARAVLYEPNDRHWSVINAAEQEARERDAGLWGACSGRAG